MIRDVYGNTRFFGVYRGVVTEVNATTKQIRAKVPQILGDTPTGWAWMVQSSGLPAVMPSTNQGVWIMFEGGDPSYPIWAGTFNETPIATAPTTTVNNTTVEMASTPTAVRWSPVFGATGLTFTGTDTTYPTYNSFYIKHGQLVTFNIKIDLNTVTNFGTGQFTVELPFDPIPSAGNHFSAWSWVDPSQPADELNGHKQLVADHIPGSKILDFHWLKETTASPKPLIESPLVQGTPVTFTTASKMYVNGTYIAAQ